MIEISDDLKEAMCRLGETCKVTVEAFTKLFTNICDNFKPAMQIYLKPNSRIKHLALYHKKARVRKKNLKRLMVEKGQ